MWLIHKCLSFFRIILGTKQILQQQQLLLQQQHRLKIEWLQYQQVQQQEQQKQHISLMNGLMCAYTDPKAFKESTAFKRCAEIISLLSPMDIEGAKYIRIGKDYDGGYVMFDGFTKDKIDAAYSFGIKDDVSWDEQIAGRGIDVFMYDHTIARLPKENPRFHFFNTGLTGHKKAQNLKTLAELLAQNSHTKCKNLIMKMDIEGCEWDVFQEIESNVINQFSQIVVEFHFLISAVYDTKALTAVVETLKKINQTHKSVHVHANLINSILSARGMIIPNVLEVTYVRHTDGKYKFIPNTRQFPTEIDQPTFQGWPDLYLGNFSI